MSYRNIIATIALISIVFPGCVVRKDSVKVTMRSIPHNSYEYESIFERDYYIGRKKSAHIGDKMFFYKKHLKRVEKKFKPNADAVLQDKYVIRKDNIYTATGAETFDGIDYLLVKINDKFGVFVNEQGVLYKMYRTPGGSGREIKYIPKTLRFVSIFESKIVKNDGDKNIDILYSGLSNGSINFMYREFTQDNSEQPVFFQNLFYKKDVDVIRLKNFRIKVYSTSNQEVIYTILDDSNPNDVQAGFHFENRLKLIVSKVIKGSPASESGVMVGDRIISINNVKVSTVPQTKKAFKSFGRGVKVIVTIIRNGESLQKTLELG